MSMSEELVDDQNIIPFVLFFVFVLFYGISTTKGHLMPVQFLK